MFARTLLAFAAALALNTTASAGVVLGGSTLLNDAGLTQLENWLGTGEKTFTNIFTKTEGDTAQSFHSAADSKGATFTLMTVSTNGGATWKTIGGYNPLSWSSQSEYNYSDNLSDLTAFIFNLTDLVKSAQRSDSQGQYQTYNYSAYGPTFGGGHDVYVNSSLNNGYSFGYSYGNAGGGSYGTTNIVTQNSDIIFFAIDSLEVFTLSEFTGAAQQNVPEPASFGLAAIALLGLGAASRRRRQLPG